MSPMVPSPADPLDESIASLLDEALRDPRASLFRRERASEALSDGRRSDPWSARSASATLVERHLLAVHREEVGYLLRDAFCRAFTHDRANDRAYTRRFETLAEERWRQAAEAEVERAPGPQDPAHRALLALARSGGADPLGGLSAAELATITLRFDPNDQARIYCAAELQSRGQHDSAAALLERVLAGHPTRVNAWCAWRNLGYNELALGRREHALEHYHTAAGIGETQPDLWGWTFALALGLGDAERARQAARYLDLLEPDVEAAWVRELRDDVARYGAVRAGDGPRARSVIGRLADQLGPVSTEVAHAVPL